MALPLLILLAPSFVRAGDIVGQVSDANTSAYLRGVAVQVAEIGRSAVTDREGRYELKNVPAGSYTITASYLGYDSLVDTVQVPESGRISKHLLLGGEVVRLEDFVVESYRESRSMALQQKRTATNLIEVVSSDSVGTLPDRNVAEALARLPGLSIDTSKGEGQFVTIRGVEPNLNNVTFNGAMMAPPSVSGRSGRAMPLDVIAASQITQIEVIKAVTPDMDANALGGTINIKTVSGFDRKNSFAYGAIEGGENQASGDSIYGADLTFGKVYGANRTFGVALAANYSKRHTNADRISTAWGLDADRVYLVDLVLRPERGVRERKGFNLNLEFRPNYDTELFFRTIYSKFDETTDTDENQLSDQGPRVFVTPTRTNVSRLRSELRVFHEESFQTLSNYTLGGSKRFGRFQLSGDVNYSEADEVLPFFQGAQFRTGNVNAPAGTTYVYDWSSFYPTVDHKDVLSAPTTAIPFRRFREDDSTMLEETWTPRIDLRGDFDELFGGRTGFFKVGAKYTDRARFIDDNSARPSSDKFTIDQMNARLPGFAFFDGRYFTPVTVNLKNSFDFLNANRAAFPDNALNSAQNSVEDDYDITEEIVAVYGFASIDVNPKLKLMAGGRYERTDATLVGWAVITGNSPDTDTGTFGGIVENSGTFKYDNFLPNFQARYELSEQSALRFAVTGTIGRPAYEDGAPKGVLRADLIPDPIDPAFPNSGSLEIGNPSLVPYEAVNFDLAYEFYLKSGGAITVGAFHKSIDNAIYEFSENQQNVIQNGIAFESLSVSSVQNADRGYISGLETNFQVPFKTFTSGFFGYFGIDLNVTIMDSKVEVPERPGEEFTFFRQPDEVVNFALYFERGGFSARVAYNHQSDSILTVGSTPLNDVYQNDRHFYDLQASYQINKTFTVYANWQNVTNETDEQYIGDSSRLNAARIYGSNIRAGVRFVF